MSVYISLSLRIRKVMSTKPKNKLNYTDFLAVLFKTPPQKRLMSNVLYTFDHRSNRIRSLGPKKVTHPTWAFFAGFLYGLFLTLGQKY